MELISLKQNYNYYYRTTKTNTPVDYSQVYGTEYIGENNIKTIQHT